VGSRENGVPVSRLVGDARKTMASLFRWAGPFAVIDRSSDFVFSLAIYKGAVASGGNHQMRLRRGGEEVVDWW
jgi:hypothetical protein